VKKEDIKVVLFGHLIDDGGKGEISCIMTVLSN